MGTSLAPWQSPTDAAVPMVLTGTSGMDWVAPVAITSWTPAGAVAAQLGVPAWSWVARRHLSPTAIVMPVAAMFHVAVLVVEAHSVRLA